MGRVFDEGVGVWDDGPVAIRGIEESGAAFAICHSALEEDGVSVDAVRGQDLVNSVPAGVELSSNFSQADALIEEGEDVFLSLLEVTLTVGGVLLFGVKDFRV